MICAGFISAFKLDLLGMSVSVVLLVKLLVLQNESKCEMQSSEWQSKQSKSTLLTL